MTLLVVDDQEDSREMLAVILENRGARIVQGESSQSALAVLEGDAIDLVSTGSATRDIRFRPLR